MNAVSGAIGFVARFGLAIVWLWSGTAKLLAPLDSEQAIGAYEIVPASWVPPLAVALPAFELVLGLMLLAGVFLTTMGRDALFLAMAAWTAWRPFGRFAIRP